MATPAQIEANRANSQKSSGPKTAEGKAAARRNAMRHGLTSTTLSINEADNLKLDALIDDLLAEHQPLGPTEELVFCKMVEQYWLSRRGAARLTAITQDPDAKEDGPMLSLIVRYNTTATNGFYRALRELDRLQTLRKKTQLSVDLAPPEPDAKIEAAPEIGFVSQNADTPVNPNSARLVTPISTPSPRPQPANQTPRIDSHPASNAKSEIGTNEAS